MGRLKGPKARVTLLGVAVAMAFGGCGSPHHSTAGESTTNPEPTGIAVIAEPSTNGPPVCHLLAASVPLRQLPSALELRYEPTLGGQARTVIRSAAVQLTQIAKTTNGRLAAQLNAAAAALGPLAGSSTPSAAVNTLATQTLTILGQEVQSECDFPVG